MDGWIDGSMDGWMARWRQGTRGKRQRKRDKTEGTRARDNGQGQGTRDKEKEGFRSGGPNFLAFRCSKTNRFLYILDMDEWIDGSMDR